MTYKVLVTGYGGFLGAEISRQLLRAGYSVRGIARKSYTDLKQFGVETVAGDLEDERTVLAACEGVDAVIHTAAKAGVWGSFNSYFRPNVVATRNIIAACKHHCVRALVHCSSPSVTFDGREQEDVDESVPYPTSWLCNYPRTKAIAEQEVLKAAEDGLRCCSLRPHLIWGAGDPHLFPRLIERAKQGRLIRIGSGTNLIDTVHVRNAAHAHLLALERLLRGEPQLVGKSYFITDGQPIACWTWIRKVVDAAGVPLKERSISMAMAYRIGAILETLFRLAGKTDEPPMTRFVAKQLGLPHYFSIERARKDLGYNPQLDRDHELAELTPWLKELGQRQW